mgnify:FL=1|tara:strand:- start:410 stop:955 length:546 start_codon:yes stop_codon:yes gene_type:complete
MDPHVCTEARILAGDVKMSLESCRDLYDLFGNPEIEFIGGIHNGTVPGICFHSTATHSVYFIDTLPDGWHTTNQCLHAAPQYVSCLCSLTPPPSSPPSSPPPRSPPEGPGMPPPVLGQIPDEKNGGVFDFIWIIFIVLFIAALCACLCCYYCGAADECDDDEKDKREKCRPAYYPLERVDT